MSAESYLQVDNLSKSFGALHLFSDVIFSLDKGEKAGLIAPNGSGKTTLLKMITGEESIDSGEVIFRNDLKVTYLPQRADFSSYPNILDACLSELNPELKELLSRYETAAKRADAETVTSLLPKMDAMGAWDIEQQVTALLDRLHLTDPLAPTTNLSGGESKRISLAAALLGQPDIIILDEPTNHLDPDIIEWLEGHLIGLTTTSILMVTHDRYFLDRVCDTILELDNGSLYTYEGNYSKYLEKRDERLAAMQQEQEKLSNLYRRELEWMRRMPKARGTKAQYRKDAFKETEDRLRTLASYKNESGPRLDKQNVYIGKKTCDIKNIAKSFGEKTLFQNFSYTFSRRDRVGVIGPNGSGKSTLLKMILGQLEPDQGEIEIGETVRFGYFAQQPFHFSPEEKVIDIVRKKAEKIVFPDGSVLTAMQLLTRFLFHPSRQQDYVYKLSGGELRRLQLCTVLMENPNFLVLDEPTNDLDIPTLQVLEDYLAEFSGCILVASHDRFFMDRLTDHLFVLGNGTTITDFPGGYTLYMEEKKAKEQEEKALAQQEEKAQKAKTATTSVPDKPKEKTKLTYKEKQEYLALSDEIPQLEEKIAEIEGKMADSSNLTTEEVMALSQDYSDLKEQLDLKELRWLELSEYDL